MTSYDDFNYEDMNVAVSVIVPAYNCENSIGGLIDSLKKQSLSNFEVIIVDDGSMDKTTNLVNELTFQDNRFILIKKVNGGPASARNAGLQKAKGGYVTFADSDDLFEKDYLRKMFEEASNNSLDMVVCGYILRMESINGQVTNRTITLPSKQGNNKNEVCSIFTDLLVNNLAFSVWNKMIKRSVIINNDILFNDFSIAEDRIFVLDVISHCNNLSIIEDCLYIYTLSSNGNQTRKYNKDRFEAMKSYCIKLSNYYKVMDYNDGEKIVKEVLIKAVLSSLVAHYDDSCNLNRRDKSIRLNEILYDNFLNSILRNPVKVSTISTVLSFVYKSKIIWVNKFLAKTIYFILINFPQVVNDKK
jgi:glycosyltransferase involved in cell wall biosynthesis